MASNPENVRSNVLMKLQEALDEEAILEEQILTLMHRFADRFTDRRVEINNLMVLQDHPLIDYGKYALGCMTGADMKKCVHLKSVRDELLRSMEEKRQLMTNYRDIFNTIITSLKALDESFSSRNHVRKFLRALPSKWRPKVMAIEESKDLSKLSLDELVGNLKVYEVALEKDMEIATNKKEKIQSRISRNSLEEEASLSDNPMTTKGTSEKSRKIKRKIEDASSVVIQIASLVIAPPKLFLVDQKAFRCRKLEQ
ncbi:hypothetical protein Tco_0238350 [Tanacetum coccineum]